MGYDDGSKALVVKREVKLYESLSLMPVGRLGNLSERAGLYGKSNTIFSQFWAFPTLIKVYQLPFKKMGPTEASQPFGYKGHPSQRSCNIVLMQKVHFMSQ